MSIQRENDFRLSRRLLRLVPEIYTRRNEIETAKGFELDNHARVWGTERVGSNFDLLVRAIECTTMPSIPDIAKLDSITDLEI